MPYNANAVDKAIRASRSPIGKREARLIHRLLSGRERLDIRSDLSHAVTRFDRKQESKAHHNPYALGHYLMACDRALAAMAKGERLIEALYGQFHGALLCHLINWFSDDVRKAKAARRMPK